MPATVAPKTTPKTAAPAAAEPVVPVVRVPRRLYEIVRGWPDMVDRTRAVAPHLLPVTRAYDAAVVRAVLCGLLPLADGQRTVAVPADVWALVADWPPLLERARFAGVPFTVDETLGLQTAARLFGELAALAEAEAEAAEGGAR